MARIWCFTTARRGGSMTDIKRPPARSKSLSALDLELWSAVTADVRPFRARPIHAKPEPVSASEARPFAAASPQRDAPRTARFPRSRTSITALGNIYARAASTSMPNSICMGCARPRRITR